MKREINKWLILIGALSAALTFGVLTLLFFFSDAVLWQIVLAAVGCICVIALVSVFISSRLTKKIISPINTMVSNLENIDENITYSEFENFAKAVREQQYAKSENERMRHEFTANVSHELKTPLTSISGYAEMIAAGMATGDDVKTFAEKIHSESGRLVTLIGDIIKLSELDETAQYNEFHGVDIFSVAQDVADMLSFNAQKLNVSINVEGESCVIDGDESMISELVYNICDNAIRYNRTNGIVNVSVKSAGNFAVLTVKDTGIGIPKEHQARIFERFYRVDKSRSKETGGTGLGLAIVKHIAIRHNALIEIVSDGKTGTAVTVRFPEKVSKGKKDNG